MFHLVQGAEPSSTFSAEVSEEQEVSLSCCEIGGRPMDLRARRNANPFQEECRIEKTMRDGVDLEQCDGPGCAIT